jgi:hypothetical protein
MVSSALAILSVMSFSEDTAGRFVAAFADFRDTRGLVFRGFFDISSLPDHAAISGLLVGRKPLK